MSRPRHRFERPLSRRRPSQRLVRVAIPLIALWTSMYGAGAQENPQSTPSTTSLKFHVYGGLPATEHVYVRQGYVLGFNPETRTPSWVAYRVVPEYRRTPRREGPFKRLRDDPDIANEPAYEEYRGVFDARGFARGHLAPYAVMGGDRDGDGRQAEYHRGNPENVGDPDDARTLFEANYMSNIAPQHHEGFNNGGRVNGEHRHGLWYELERWIQDELVARERREVWVFAGCVFGPGEHERIGPNKDIVVPPMYFKLVIYEEAGNPEPIVFAFLLPHQRVRHGELDAFLVSVNTIEAMTGLDFFRDLDDLAEASLENRETWETHRNKRGVRP